MTQQIWDRLEKLKEAPITDSELNQIAFQITQSQKKYIPYTAARAQLNLQPEAILKLLVLNLRLQKSIANKVVK